MDIAVCEGTSLLWEITCHIGLHSVTFNLAVVTVQPLPQLKLEIDVPIPEGCKAELTWVVVTSQDSLPVKDGHLSQK